MGHGFHSLNHTLSGGAVTVGSPSLISALLYNYSLPFVAQLNPAGLQPHAWATLAADLRCRAGSRPCAAAAVHPLRGEYCKCHRSAAKGWQLRG